MRTTGAFVLTDEASGNVSEAPYSGDPGDHKGPPPGDVLGQDCQVNNNCSEENVWKLGFDGQALTITATEEATYGNEHIQRGPNGRACGCHSSNGDSKDGEMPDNSTPDVVR